MKKKWTTKTIEDKKVDFFPMFEVDWKTQDVNCQKLMMRIDGSDYTFNYDLFLMLCYTIANEEQRKRFANIEMRGVSEIPYDVTFKISKEEKEKGIAKRRITLPVDELIINLASQEAMKSKFLKRA